MPRHIEFSNGHFVDYQYALNGTRLREAHGVRRTTTQIVGGKAHTVTSRMLADSLIHIAPWLEYDGKKYYYKFQGGYYAFTLHRTTHEPNPGRLYFYACDHQGNVRSVLHADGAVVKEVQQTHYYPFGGPIAGLGTAPGFQRRKYNGKVLDRLYGLDLYDYAARQYDPVLLRFTSPDPLAEKTYGQSVYGYCINNPVNAIDPDGKTTYLYVANLPGNDCCLLKCATHTFIVVTDESGRVRGYFAYGSEFGGIKGSITGRLVRQNYYQDRNVITGKDKVHKKNIIKVNPPNGMSSNAFDDRVINVAKSFGTNPNITYHFAPICDTQGNCNSSTSTILIKSGVTEKEMERIKKEIPGISWGFSTTNAKPWTNEEQKTAVDKNKLQKMITVCIQQIGKYIK